MAGAGGGRRVDGAGRGRRQTPQRASPCKLQLTVTVLPDQHPRKGGGLQPAAAAIVAGRNGPPGTG